MNWPSAELIARGGVPVRQHAWTVDPRFTGASMVFSAGAGTTRAVLVFRKSGSEVVARPGFSMLVTGNAGTDVLTAAKSVASGDEVYFTALTGGAGLSTSVMYFVRDVVGLTFKVSATDGGAAVNFTSDITGGMISGGHFGAAQYLADDWEVA